MITTQSSTSVPVVFKQFRVMNDTSTYIGVNASDVNRDSLTLRSNAPKAGNGFLGNRRSTISRVNTTPVSDLLGNTVARDRKISIDFSLPVGTTKEQLVEDAAELRGLLDDADFLESLCLVGAIEY